MKYIIDVPDEAIELMGGHISIFVEPVFKTGDCKRYALRISKGDIEPYTEPDRKAIEDEVWELVRIITDMTEKQRIECFGGATCNLDKYWTYQDAKEKYEAWLKKKEEIRVGDEVEYECCGEVVKFIVTGFIGSIVCGFKWPCGYDDVGDYCRIEDLRKTGRHFPEVEDLLKKMEEGDRP